ncbi:MAG: anti-sigma factor family protein [Egibacteraceae bacterium]
MDVSTYAERLACGTAVADLLDHVADDLPVEAHHRDCVDCRAALAELVRVWTAVHRLAGEPVAVPPGFTSKVRRRIANPLARGVARPRVWVPLPATGRGVTHLDGTAIAPLVELAAASVPGVAVGSATTSGASVRVGPTPGRLAVSVEIQVAYGDDLIAAAAAVRLAVIVQLLAVAGLEDVSVDVAVTGIVE